MGDTLKRSLVKTISWRFWATIITATIVFSTTGEWKYAAAVGLIDTTIKFAAYFFHERVWNRITFGKKYESVEVRHLSGGAQTKYKGDRGKVVWMTGLSGSGKSTIAETLWEMMESEDYKTVILDGDNIRKGLCNDLGFSMEDRKENIRRNSEVCKLFSDNGINVITAFISPTREDRVQAAELIGRDVFREVYVKCSLDACEKRDPKGLYKKARSGEIPNFTGIDSPYTPPASPSVTVDTERLNEIECAQLIMEVL